MCFKTIEDGVVNIPIEDLNQIMVHGANIRFLTMDLSILSQNKVVLITLDEKYLPTAIVLPFEEHARQSKLMHAQVNVWNCAPNEYILNTRSMKFHLPERDCVKDIGKRNTEDSSKSKDELIEEGDSYCKICNP